MIEEKRGLFFVILTSVITTLTIFLLINLLDDFSFVGIGKKKPSPNFIANPQLKATEVTPTTSTIQEPNGGAQLQVTGSNPEIENLIKKVFQHIFLPGGQVKVETVIKADELRKINPIFYQFVKAGDKILIYSDRAILYDPKVDKVLDVIHIPTK